jgi:hypothetical protein
MRADQRRVFASALDQGTLVIPASRMRRGFGMAKEQETQHD